MMITFALINRKQIPFIRFVDHGCIRSRFFCYGGFASNHHSLVVTIPPIIDIKAKNITSTPIVAMVAVIEDKTALECLKYHGMI